MLRLHPSPPPLLLRCPAGTGRYILAVIVLAVFVVRTGTLQRALQRTLFAEESVCRRGREGWRIDRGGGLTGAQGWVLRVDGGGGLRAEDGWRLGVARGICRATPQIAGFLGHHRTASPALSTASPALSAASPALSAASPALSAASLLPTSHRLPHHIACPITSPAGRTADHSRVTHTSSLACPG
eukprot:365749-Chlamydomonas_euryale.AAC.11